MPDIIKTDRERAPSDRKHSGRRGKGSQGLLPGLLRRNFDPDLPRNIKLKE